MLVNTLRYVPYKPIVLTYVGCRYSLLPEEEKEKHHLISHHHQGVPTRIRVSGHMLAPHLLPGGGGAGFIATPSSS
jgi:hypothetical protein